MALSLIRSVIVAAAVCAAASPVPLASADNAVVCASRIYDYLRHPVTHFAIESRKTELISADAYARYRTDLLAAASGQGYDATDATFTLHETLSAFPFLNRGVIREVVFVLCAAGGERDNLCRRADYYVYDALVDTDRLSLMLADTLDEALPAPVDSCDFGQGDWSALD
jgi:hypothetical protein